jgi:hypothetical protein
MRATGRARATRDMKLHDPCFRASRMASNPACDSDLLRPIAAGLGTYELR